MDPRTPAPLVPLHLTSFAILSPQNTPLYVHSFTGKQDELRHYHLSHAALDVIEERSESQSNETVLPVWNKDHREGGGRGRQLMGSRDDFDAE